MIPVVAIGTSAGGLKEIEVFFKHMPKSKKVAFVIIQHLSPHHKSILAEIVKRYTEMDVAQITKKTKVQAGKVYIIPPNKLLSFKEGNLVLSPFPPGKSIHLPIDIFFRSLKDSQGEKAVAVILSGTGSDGSLGIKEVKEGGGLCLVQEPSSAEYDGMPINAINTGLIDYVVSVEKMPELILDYIKNNYNDKSILNKDDKKSEILINQIFQIIKTQTGNDFSQYKRNTIHRRIERRLTVNKSKSLENYLKLLKSSSTEIISLSKELLISVTSFFRDKEVFEKIKNDVIPDIVKKCNGKNIRVWVPGCATGEEAFSLAILIKNYLDIHKLSINLQVFASDVDTDAIEKAREGFYTKNLVADIDEELLNKYFLKDNDGFRVKKSLRESVIFAEQNLLQDPPYSKIDFISCRNLLIYLNNDLQSKAISIFNYALNENGILLLGNSESLGAFSNYFDIIDRKLKIFKKASNIDIRVKVPKFKFESGYNKSNSGNEITEPVPKLAQHFLLENYTPPSVVIDYKGNMIYIQGKTGKYIENTTGVVSTDILKNVREGIKIPLANAIRKTKAENKKNIQKNVRVKTNDGYDLVDVHVSPLKKQNSDTKLLLVVFKAVEKENNATISKSDNKIENSALIELERELAEKEHYLQNTIEELETTNEELKSSNEEAQSTNEELQSTNEELETSKEELQSVNEELATTNNELNIKIDEIYKVNNDLQNLLNATNIATIFLDREFKIFNFTPSISSIIELLNADIGRSIKQFTNNLKNNSLIDDARTVLKTLIPYEAEVENLSGEFFWMRITPYRTTDNKIEGLVLTFTDITEKKKQEKELEKYRDHLEELVEEKSEELIKSEEKFRNIFNLSQSMICIADIETATFKLVNPAFSKILGYTEDELLSKSFLDFVHPDDVEPTIQVIETEMKAGKNVFHFVNRYRCKDNSYKWLNWNSKNLPDTGISYSVATDITELKKAEFKLQESERVLEEAQNIAHLGSFQYIAANKETIWSTEEYRIYGMNPSESSPAYETMLRECIHPEDADLLHEKFTQAMQSNSVYELEHRIVQPNGNIRWVYDKAHPYFNKEGKLERYIGVTLDITERTLAEQALRESEERLKLIINESPFPIAITDTNDERIQYWSHSAKKLVGYTPDKVYDWYELAYPDPDYRKEVIERWKPFLKIAQESGKAVNTGEYRIACQDGSVKICELYAQFIPNNLVVTINDITERKKAEQKLIEKNEYIQRILDDFPIGIATNEIDSSKVNFINSKFSEIYGWPAEEFPTTLDFFNKVFPDKAYREKLQQKIIADIESGDPEKMHWENLHITTKTGEKRIVNAFNIPFTDQNIMLSTVQDVTKRRKAELDLLHEKEKAQQYLDVASVIMVSLDKKGNVILMNPKGCEVLGYRKEEIIGMNWIDNFLPPEQREDVKEVLDKSTSGNLELVEYYENEVLCKNGKQRIIAWHNSALKDPNGKLIGVFSSGEDITERKNAENDLLANQHYLQKAQEIGSIGTWHIDLANNILTWTEENYKIFGIKNNTPIDYQCFMECVHPNDRQFVDKEWKKGIKNKYYDIKHRLLVNGAVKWVREKAEFSSNKKGEITQAFGVTQDITERINAERQLIEAKKKAEENDRLKSAFLANMSHEIRTPMNGLLGFADLLREKDISQRKRDRYIDIIENQSKKLLFLIDDILDISKIESGQLKTSEKSCHLSSIIKSLELTFNQTKKLKNKEHLNIIAKIPDNYKNIVIKSDPYRLQQVISNLLSNAIKFTEEGSIEFGYSVSNKKVHFFVKDEGVGIPKEKLPLIFKRFEQINSIGHEFNEGTGLGLAISKGIVELLKGKIEVQSEINKGTIFTFYIPLIPADNKNQVPEKKAIVNQDIIKGKKILIVEDELINIDLFKAIFNNNLENILFVKDGHEAVKITQERSDIDVILMDLRMPKMDGYKATKQILKENPKAKIIAQTAYAKPQDEIDCLQQGFVDYISKPINKELLFKTLAKWI